MSILFRSAHNPDHYERDLKQNADHQINHLADEVAHNLRFAAFGCSPAQRLETVQKELKMDRSYLSQEDFNREVATIEYRLPNRDLEIQRDRHGNVTGLDFNGANIYEKQNHVRRVSCH